MNLLLALIGCKGQDETTDDGTEPPPICGEVNATQVSAGLTTSVTSPGCGSLELADFRVLGEGAFTVDLFSDGERVIPHVVAETDGVFRGLHVTGTFTLDGTEPARLWRQAYASGPSELSELPDLVEVDGEGVPILAGEPAGTSAWAGLVGRPDGASVIVGVHSAIFTRFAAAFAAGGTVHAVWGGQGEEVPLAAGNELFLDPLFLAMGPDPNDLWETWVAAVAENAGIVPPSASPPLGFAMHLQPDQPALDNLRDAFEDIAALEQTPGVVVPTVVFVEEWQASLDTTADMAAEILAAGLVPAIRIVPFLVPPDDPLVSEHPDWWVTDPTGAPVYPYQRVFDVTRPDAAAAVSELVRSLVDEGWQILVLDNMDAGAVEGVRSVPTTGTLAYRLALDIVRAAAGDVRIVAADAPLLPSAGLVDGFRIDGGLAGIFTGDVWWWIDGGEIGAARSLFEPNPMTGEAIAAALMGGTWRVASLTESVEVTLSADLLGLGADQGRPSDPLATTGSPVRWRFASGEVALINWSFQPTTIDGPGGVELLTGEMAPPGERVLAPGAGEVWIPDAASSRRRDQGEDGR